MGWSRFYVPEIHDVHPGMASRLDDLLGVLPEPAQQVALILAVPNWQGNDSFEEDDGFAARVRSLPGEKVLHGWTHSLGPDFWNWFWYGQDNRSEFARLSEDEATERLDCGLKTWERSLGARPRWFCAPRWQESSAASRALKKAGLAGSMRSHELVPFGGEKVDLPSLWFDEGERKWKNAVGRSLRRSVIDRLFASSRPFRLTLHPADVEDAKTWGQVSDLARRLDGEGWVSLSLDDTLGRWKASAKGRVQ